LRSGGAEPQGQQREADEFVRSSRVHPVPSKYESIRFVWELAARTL
jgi:hypothetical protein